jgi:adenine-specific DNA-methyltransferase
MHSNGSGQKEIGSYYTPQLLADFMVYHLFDKAHYTLPDEVSILEPSVGDGVFVEAMFNNQNFKGRIQTPTKINLLAIERDAGEIAKAKMNANAIVAEPNFAEFTHNDYLNFHLSSERKFDLIIGNPPYIKSNHLDDGQLENCIAIHKQSNLSSKKIKNIWTSFLIGGVQALSDDGVLAFVLPAELLQVIYAKEIRDLLRDSFNKIEIFTFNELIFADIEQDVIVLICAKKQEKGVSFYHVDKLEQLKKPEFFRDNSNIHRETLDKWTNYILSDNDLAFLDGLKEKMQLKTVRSYCDSITGIVTAANDYLITDQKTVDEYGLQDIATPILKKGAPSTAQLTSADIAKMNQSGLPTSFLAFEDTPSNEFPEGFKAYLKVGVSSEIDQRYKMKLRNNWYAVPSVWASEGFFTKRSNIFPRVIVNEAKVLVTDSFYRISMKEGFSIYDLSFSFHNTLSFIFAELEGRYYGGSVLELTPNEFKNLYTPYVKKIPRSSFGKLDKILRSRPKVGDVLDYTDQVILKKHYGLGDDEISRLRAIYKSLIIRRLKGSSARLI